MLHQFRNIWLGRVGLGRVELGRVGLECVGLELKVQRHLIENLKRIGDLLTRVQQRRKRQRRWRLRRLWRWRRKVAIRPLLNLAQAPQKLRVFADSEPLDRVVKGTPIRQRFAL